SGIVETYINLGLGELAHTKLTIDLADRTVKYPKGISENMLVRIGKFVFPVDFIILDMPKDIKVPLILGRQFLSTGRAKIDVYKRKITLRGGEEKVVFKSVKPTSSLIKKVYMLSLRERMELDLQARLMGETLVLNRSLDPFFEDYMENDLNEPIELRRNQGDNLIPTIEEGELAHTKLTIDLADRTVKYPKGISENMLVRIGKFVFPVDFIILDMPKDIKVPLILGRQFLSTGRAKIDVYKRKITLRGGEEKVVFKSVKPTSSLIKKVYMLSLRERMELDLQARLMGETLVLNRSLDPFFEDYMENDLNEPIELRRN
nr:hypothetical protein [Tanacetum cinerariifolium]